MSIAGDFTISPDDIFAKKIACVVFNAVADEAMTKESFQTSLLSLSEIPPGLSDLMFTPFEQVDIDELWRHRTWYKDCGTLNKFTDHLFRAIERRCGSPVVMKEARSKNQRLWSRFDMNMHVPRTEA